MASWRGKKVWLPSRRGKYGLWLPGKEAISLHPLRPAASRCVPLRPLRPLRPRASAASGCVRLRPAASYVGSDIERIYAEMGALDALTYVLFCMHDMRNSYLECMCWMRLLLPSVPREKFSVLSTPSCRVRELYMDQLWRRVVLQVRLAAHCSRLQY